MWAKKAEGDKERYEEEMKDYRMFLPTTQLTATKSPR